MYDDDDDDEKCSIYHENHIICHEINTLTRTISFCCTYFTQRWSDNEKDEMTTNVEMEEFSDKRRNQKNRLFYKRSVVAQFV